MWLCIGVMCGWKDWKNQKVEHLKKASYGFLKETTQS